MSTAQKKVIHPHYKSYLNKTVIYCFLLHIKKKRQTKVLKGEKLLSTRTDKKKIMGNKKNNDGKYFTAMNLNRSKQKLSLPDLNR